MTTQNVKPFPNFHMISLKIFFWGMAYFPGQWNKTWGNKKGEIYLGY